MLKYVVHVMVFLAVLLSYAWICHTLHFEHIEGLAPIVAVWVTMQRSDKVLEWIKK